MAAKFGTSGLRGLVQDLLGEPVRRHVRAFVQHLRNIGALTADRPIYVGWDFRDSSPAIVADVAAALYAEELEPLLCGNLPTPVLAFSAISAGAPSIMVTGSHIPADRNGLKFFLPTGEISKQDEEQITTLAPLIQPTSIMVDAESIAAGRERTGSIARFVARLQPVLSERPLTGWSIGVYQHSTVARDLLVEVLSAAGATCTPLARSATFIPVDTEAVAEDTLQAIASWCRDGSYDAIVSADGDGDRPLLADGNGKLLRGDFLGMITSRFLRAKVIATPVTSNSGIETFCNAEVMRTRVGSPYVLEAMSRSVQHGREGVVGFEANGGFLTATPFAYGGGVIAPLPTRDCFLPVLAVLATATQEGVGLAELQGKYRLPCAAAGRLQDFPIEASARLLLHLSANPLHIESLLARPGDILSINSVDGLRVTLQGGEIVHFRASGNAPEFRCYVEHETQQGAEHLLTRSLDAVRRFA